MESHICLFSNTFDYKNKIRFEWTQLISWIYYLVWSLSAKFSIPMAVTEIRRVVKSVVLDYIPNHTCVNLDARTHTHTHTNTHTCVCVCVCVRARTCVCLKWITKSLVGILQHNWNLFWLTQLHNSWILWTGIFTKYKIKKSSLF